MVLYFITKHLNVIFEYIQSIFRDKLKLIYKCYLSMLFLIAPPIKYINILNFEKLLYILLIN